jgi:hypothetical protein
VIPQAGNMATYVATNGATGQAQFDTGQYLEMTSAGGVLGGLGGTNAGQYLSNTEVNVGFDFTTTNTPSLFDQVLSPSMGAIDNGESLVVRPTVTLTTLASAYAAGVTDAVVEDGQATTKSTPPKPSLNIPENYPPNADGVTYTGPGGGSLTVAGTAADGVTPVFERSTGGYFTLDANGNQVPVLRTDPNNGITWTTPLSDVSANYETHFNANNEAATDFQNQGVPNVTKNVSITAANPNYDPDIVGSEATVTSVADQVLKGDPGTVVNVPEGYRLEDLNENPILDENGNPVTTFKLGDNGVAVIEVKTGAGGLTTNQGIVYPQVPGGSTRGVGQNATDAGVFGTIQPGSSVYVIRKLP